jgi:hypothetical protein
VPRKFERVSIKSVEINLDYPSILGAVKAIALISPEAKSKGKL